MQRTCPSDSSLESMKDRGCCCEEPKPSVLCFDGSVLNAEISVDHDMLVIENE